MDWNSRQVLPIFQALKRYWQKKEEMEPNPPDSGKLVSACRIASPAGTVFGIAENHAAGD